MTTPARTALDDQINAADTRAHYFARDHEGLTYPECGPVGNAVLARMMAQIAHIFRAQERHHCPHLDRTGVDVTWWLPELPGLWLCGRCYQWVPALGRVRHCTWCRVVLPYGPPHPTWVHVPALRREAEDPTQPDAVIPPLLVPLSLCPDCRRRNADLDYSFDH